MNLSNDKKQQIELIKLVYKEHIDFNTYSFKSLDYYCEQLGRNKVIKQLEQVIVYAPYSVLQNTQSICITFDGSIISFKNKDNKVIFKTYGQSYEDIVGLDKVKGFILD